jgi:polar amino acid transport system substrate-binding protein
VNRPRAGAIGVVVSMTAIVAGAACANVDVPELQPDPATSEAPEPVERDGTRDDGRCVASFRPDGPADANVAPGSYMDRVQQQGELRVGVDGGTPRFSNVDTTSGDLEGFDIDIAREVSGALFGDPNAVELVRMPPGDRVQALVDGDVDLVVHTFTITCDRWDEVAFSTEYFTAGLRFLVQVDNPAAEFEDLVGQRVCAIPGSPAVDYIEGLAEAGPLLVQAPQPSACLLLLQQGQVDAVAADDAVLAGMVAQDPNLELRGDAVSEAPYGIGLPPEHPEWVRYVNAVLEDMRNSGRWNELYDKWLAGVPGLDVDPDPPDPAYR